MIGAMMLPASLPAFGWFSGLISGRRERRGLGASFLAGYVGVWTGFGIVAFFGDFALHHLVDHWKWLAGRPWLIGGSVLIVAGAFELSPLGRRCHTESGYMSPRLGPAHSIAYIDASQMGAEHGFRRLKRCWALMLLSFAAGMASLAWMAALTLVMILQGKRSISERARLHLGIGLLALAGLVIAHRGWMPSLFPSSG